MKKAAQKIKNYAPNVNIVNNNNLEKRLLNILLASFGVCIFAYIFILGSITFNVVARQSLGSEVRSLSNEVGDLELRYLSLSNKIDLTMSSEMGFKEAKTQFAVRKSLGTLSLLTNEF
ncbi:MAG: hypothetical protein WCI93_00625 [bacterium]